MPDETTAPADPGPPPATPELDRMRKAREEGHSEDIGAFLEWLGEQGLIIGRWRNDTGFAQEGGGIQQLLATYFKIDLNEVDRERRALLAWHVAKSAYLADQEVKARPRVQGPAPTVESWPAS